MGVGLLREKVRLFLTSTNVSLKECRWLYRLFVAIDGNFRLKRRMVSSEERDPGLNAGWAYFVEAKRFNKHLLAEWDTKQEVRVSEERLYPKLISVFRGVHVSLMTPLTSLIVKRVAWRRQVWLLLCAHATNSSCRMALVTCRRERGAFCICMTWVSETDISFRRRYTTVDFIAFSGLHWFKIRELVISYDIACQWHKKLMQRIGRLPRSIRPTYLTALTVLIPKFHLPAHVEYCHRTYSFNLTKGVGRTDGEAPERGWARMNDASKSTTEMGPGLRRDTLDDQFGDEAWQITKRLGE